MPSDAAVEFHSRVPEAKARLDAAALQATREVFLTQMVPDAKRASPVDTGHNASTIDATVEQGVKGVEARMFTASGYGGYLEVGTFRMKARPYIYPAFQRHIGELKQRIRALLKGF